MRRVFCFFTVMLAVSAFVGCGEKKTSNDDITDSLEVSAAIDTAAYGIVGEGTMMHTVELVSEDDSKSSYALNVDAEADVQGGVLAGDRITLVASKNARGEMEVTKLVNITSLCGKWTSLDRNFEIKEDGSVISSQAMETQPYTQWSMVNCQLVLNRDTFAVDYLGADSLMLENDKGIFAYKRVRK